MTNMFTSLRTDIDDPVERLQGDLRAVTGAAKDRINILGADLMADWAEHTPPRPFAWAMRTYSRHGLAGRHRPPINLVVSNVPGPKFPLYIAGARLSALFSVGPDPGGHRPERDRVELHRPDERLRDRLPRAASRQVHQVTDGHRRGAARAAEGAPSEHGAGPEPQTRSRIVTLAWPPPSHIVCRP